MWWVRGVSILTCKRMFFVSVMIFVWGADSLLCVLICRYAQIKRFKAL